MADLSTIERALAAQLAAVLFPAGGYLYGAATPSAALLENSPAVATPGNGSPITVRLYRGWPVAKQLDADLLANVSQVTVFPEQGMSRNTSRYRAEWFTPILNAPTLTAIAYPGQPGIAGGGYYTGIGAAFGGYGAGSLEYTTPGMPQPSPLVTFGGTGGAGQVAMVAVGGTGYAYRILANDTPMSVSVAFAAVIPNAAAAGPTLIIDTDDTVAVRIGADTTALREVSRQEQGIRVSVWCPTPWARDAVAGLCHQALVGMVDANDEPTEWLYLQNGEAVRVRPRSTFTNDKPAKDHEWRRDLCFTVEYATTVSRSQPEMLAGGLSIGVTKTPDGVPAFTKAGVTAPITTIATDGDGNIMLDGAGNIAQPLP